MILLFYWSYSSMRTALAFYEKDFLNIFTKHNYKVFIMCENIFRSVKPILMLCEISVYADYYFI